MTADTQKILGFLVFALVFIGVLTLVVRVARLHVRTEITYARALGLTVLFVVVRHQGPIGIIVGNLSGTLIVWGILLAYRSEQLGLQWDGKLLRSMNRFGIPLMAAALAMWVTNFGDRLMISKLLHGSYRLTELGQYSLANASAGIACAAGQ